MRHWRHSPNNHGHSSSPSFSAATRFSGVSPVLLLLLFEGLSLLSIMFATLPLTVSPTAGDTALVGLMPPEELLTELLEMGL